MTRMNAETAGYCLTGRHRAQRARISLGTTSGSQSVPRLFILNPGSLREPVSMQRRIRHFPRHQRHRGSQKRSA